MQFANAKWSGPNKNRLRNCSKIDGDIADRGRKPILLVDIITLHSFRLRTVENGKMLSVYSVARQCFTRSDLRSVLTP